MEHYTRRWFLKQTARGFAAAALGSLPSPARAQSGGLECTAWGSLQEPPPNGTPVGQAAQWTCESHAGFKILDIWLNAGASPWETFWIPSTGANQDPDLQAMALDLLPMDSIQWSALANSATDPCSEPNLPTATEFFPFGPASDGKLVYWGPASKPLWARPDLMDRTRMLTLGHPLLPHQAAQPYGLAGLTLGNPRRSGTGAAVQRRHAELHPDSLLPASYIFHSGNQTVAEYAAITGTHPGISRPVVVSVGSSDFGAQLAREQISPASDDLFESLRGGYTDQLRFQGEPVRSSGFGSYRVSSSLLLGAASLQAIFAGGLVSIDTPSSICVQIPGAQPNQYKPHLETELRAAAQLLSQDLARYVCLIDDGIGGGYSYDTHNGSRHLIHISANMLNLCRQLAMNIHHPTHNPEGTIDLDETLIAINTDFGRTLQLENMGRNHWPYGYVSILIGGPITSATRGIRGGIDLETGSPIASHEYTPADVRGAMLLAAGIDPFGQDGFRHEDFSSSARASVWTEEAVRDRLVECVFGL